MAHSPLGFSGAERYFNCPGSVSLIASLPPDTDEGDPEYRRAGTAAHAAAAWCLREGRDAWEAMAQPWEGYVLLPEDADAIQFYLDVIHSDTPTLSQLIEEPLSAPDIHPLAYGTLDHAWLGDGPAIITDYKHGAGIYVEVERNPQLMGYAAMLLVKYPMLEHFRLRIVQPRCHEPRVREWEISAADLRAWIETELKPAMSATKGMDLKPGEWCRFCKAKLACPAIEGQAALVEQVGPLAAPQGNTFMSDQRLADLYSKIAAVKIFCKAVEDEVLRRRLLGIEIDGTKLVRKRADRQWKAGAEDAAMAALGRDKAFTKPELLSPAQMEKVNAAGKRLVAEYAYTPDTGYTVAPLGDKRHAVEIQSPSQTFAKVLDKTGKS